ncbi:general stress protein CsbD [Echinicola salinicaeni]|uniref:general stress protein CsbD n=1 Tax=Echinicola salinicaeni TaxID=2762757 RepID=UPI001647F5F4|nr:general stress protein CsbD [Echinicola salinicaeni]
MKIVRSWREQKILLKRRFPFLSDDDFIIDSEDRNSMLDRLSKKLKKTRAELELLFAELQRY